MWFDTGRGRIVNLDQASEVRVLAEIEGAPGAEPRWEVVAVIAEGDETSYNATLAPGIHSQAEAWLLVAKIFDGIVKKRRGMTFEETMPNG